MKKQTILIAVAIAAAAAVAYFLYKKGKTAQAVAPAVDNTASKATSKKEEQNFKELVSIFRKWAPNDLAYMLPIVDEMMSGERDVHPDYLVKGQVTLPGAFVATFDSSWKASAEQWQEMHNAFNRMKIANWNI